MNIAICYESIVPARGGCETYIADLVRRLVADRHEVHLYACERDASALPSQVIYHALMPSGGPRFVRPWRFAAACVRALNREQHDVSMGFVKTWGQDVLFPQGGLHVASVAHNRHKFKNIFMRIAARVLKWFDISHWSFCLLERRQFLKHHPLVIVPSQMVRDHFQLYYGIGPERIRVIPNAIDPRRFVEHDRLKLRVELRQHCGIGPEESVGLFVGHNYRLKGLEPLLHAVKDLPALPFRLLICGSAKTRSFERLANKLGVQDRVCFLGFVPETRACYFAADFLVHPTFYDPCSLVVMEALACGLPVITSRLNGACEILHPPDDGLIVDDPHDVRQLASHIEHFCDPQRRAAASQAARRTAAGWTFEAHYRALINTLEEVAWNKQAA